MDRVRKYARELALAETMERTITECIREGILKEFPEKTGEYYEQKEGHTAGTSFPFEN